MSRRLDERVYPDYNRNFDYAYYALRSARRLTELREKRDQLLYELYSGATQQRTSATAIQDAYGVVEELLNEREWEKTKKKKATGKVDSAAYARAQQQYARDTGDAPENMDLVSSDEEEAPVAAAAAAAHVSVLEEQLARHAPRPKKPAPPSSTATHPPQSRYDRDWAWRVPAPPPPPPMDALPLPQTAREWVRRLPVPSARVPRTVMPTDRDPAAWVSRIPIPRPSAAIAAPVDIYPTDRDPAAWVARIPIPGRKQQQ